MSGYCLECGNQHCICDEIKANGVNAVLGDGWRDASKEMPPYKKLIVVCCDHGDRYSYLIYNGWDKTDEKYMKDNSIILWKEISPPAFA